MVLIKPLREDSTLNTTPGTVKPLRVSLVEPVAYPLSYNRSVGVPCAKRGNHASGTVIVLPSARSATRASSLTLTLRASAPMSSLPEVSCHDLNKQLFSKRTGSSHSPGDVVGRAPAVATTQAAATPTDTSLETLPERRRQLHIWEYRG